MDPEEIVKGLKAKLDSSIDSVKAIAEDALGRAEKGEALSNDLKEKADNALSGMNDLKARLDEFEQKAARGHEEENEALSLGAQFVGDEKVKSFLEQSTPRGRIDLSAKATISSATTNAAGSAGAGVQVTRLNGILELPQRRMTVRDLISPGRMDGNALEYVRETGFVNNAAPVAELAKKPESDLKFDTVTTTAKVIAHYMKASRQILSDFSQLSSVIDQRLLFGLSYVEEQQLLNGDGTGQNLLGMIPQATAYASPAGVTADTTIDTLRVAMLQAALAEFPATGHVLNPIDWAGIELLKDTDGRYVIGNPQGTLSPTLWGLPVVTTQAMQQSKFLTGAFKMGAQLFDRWMARVEIATENEDDFVKNLVTILAEERLALAVYRPEAFIYGDIEPATGP